VSRTPHRPPELRGQVFRGRTAIERGLLTQRQLGSKAWLRLFQGVYIDASVSVTHRLRCAVAAAYVLPPDWVIAGRSAAHLHGAGVGEPDVVEALVPLGSKLIPHRGLVVHQGSLAGDEWVDFHGLRVTTPVRTCWDLARWFEPVEAVVRIDRMVGIGKATRRELSDYLERRLAEEPPPRGLDKYARVVPLIDGRAESPQESRLRTLIVLAGLPRPDAQVVVQDHRGRFVARLDLAYEDAKVAVEYDGLWHVGSAQQMHDDRRRINALAALGWTVLHVTSVRLRDDLDGVVAEIRAALRRARKRP
jgi:very-short-patch-repair endonuclease